MEEQESKEAKAGAEQQRRRGPTGMSGSVQEALDICEPGRVIPDSEAAEYRRAALAVMKRCWEAIRSKPGYKAYRAVSDILRSRHMEVSGGGYRALCVFPMHLVPTVVLSGSTSEAQARWLDSVRGFVLDSASRLPSRLTGGRELPLHRYPLAYRALKRFREGDWKGGMTFNRLCEANDMFSFCLASREIPAGEAMGRYMDWCPEKVLGGVDVSGPCQGYGNVYLGTATPRNASVHTGIWKVMDAVEAADALEDLSDRAASRACRSVYMFARKDPMAASLGVTGALYMAIWGATVASVSPDPEIASWGAAVHSGKLLWRAGPQ